MPKVVDVDARREELAAAATRVIARSGISAASMREVAAEAGWTTGTLVHYFANKRDLLRFTLEASLDHRRSLRPDRESLAPDAALRDTLLNALPLGEQARAHWLVTIAFCAHAGDDDELGAIQLDAYRDFRRNVTDLVVACGRAQRSAATVEAERLIAAVDGVALQALFDAESWPADRQIAALDAALG